MKVTVIGANGFIGSHLVSRLTSLGIECNTPLRDDNSIYTTSLGNVIYCAGLTSDFRSRPFDTVRAHICYLANLLERANFDSFLYLSSTRVYAHQSSDSIGSEDSVLTINPGHPEELFNLSKLTGESLCLTVDRPNVRIARVSNVIGNDFESNNFLYSIIKDAINLKKIVLQTSFDSEKDYIHISDVVDLLIKIASRGSSKIYNVASGRNTTNKVLVKQISKYIDCSIEMTDNVKIVKFPIINTSKIRGEFNFEPLDIVNTIPDLINHYQNRMKV